MTFRPAAIENRAGGGGGGVGETAIDVFYPYAFAIPRNSRMSWSYDPAKGSVTTQWHLDTELLKGTECTL